MSGRSAGILLFHIRDERLRVLLVHPGGPFWQRKDDGAWSLPKGEYAGDESAADAAVREFREETGMSLSATRLIDLGEIRQRSGKRIRAWAAEGDFDVNELTSNVFELEWPPRSGKTRQFPEVDSAQWCDPETARRKLIPGQADLVDRLVSALRENNRSLRLPPPPV